MTFQKILIYSSLIICLSCQYFTDNRKTIRQNININSTPDTDKIDSKLVDSIPMLCEKKSDIKILIPAFYRGAKIDEYNAMYSENWFDFYHNKKYYLKSAEINIESSYDECSGDSSLHIFSKRASILLIKGLSPKNNRIETIKLDKERVWVGDILKFKFNSRTYILEGKGVTVKHGRAYMDKSDKPKRWDIVEDYKLYLSLEDSSTQQLLISMEKFNDTFVKILWIGDLDEDNMPDFIFDTSPNYEYNRLELFLSSAAKDGELVKLVAVSGYGFDC